MTLIVVSVLYALNGFMIRAIVVVRTAMSSSRVSVHKKQQQQQRNELVVHQRKPAYAYHGSACPRITLDKPFTSVVLYSHQ
jgi:hypothetical protein